VSNAKDLILARRARFVALALASVGCHEEAEPKAPETVVLPPTPEAGPPPVAVVEDAGPPPRDAGVPDEVSQATAVRYAQAKMRIELIRAGIAIAREKIAKLGPYGAANATSWQGVVVELDGNYESISFLSGYCPKKSPETDAFLAWLAGEQATLRRSADEARREAETKLQDKTTPGAARWDQLLQQWNQANPRPCLSIACDSW
jgi:hypothetical protein